MTAPSLTHMEKARAVLGSCTCTPSHKKAGIVDADCRRCDMAPRIARALADEHDAALERAAVACDEKVLREAGYHGQWEGYGSHMGHMIGPECAAAIRAMKNGEGR